MQHTLLIAKFTAAEYTDTLINALSYDVSGYWWHSANRLNYLKNEICFILSRLKSTESFIRC